LAKIPYLVTARRQIKTLVYVLDRVVTVGGNGIVEPQPFLVLLRGDDQLNETKLADSLGAVALRPAHADEVGYLLGTAPGSLGGIRGTLTPRALRYEVRNIQGEIVETRVSQPLRILADEALRG